MGLSHWCILTVTSYCFVFFHYLFVTRLLLPHHEYTLRDLDVMYIFLTVGCIGWPYDLLFSIKYLRVISGMCTTAALELNVELTFPTSETVSSGFLNFTFNVSCGLFIFLGSYLTHYQYLFSLMACFALASLALFSVPNAHRRKLYDNAEPYRILN